MPCRFRHFFLLVAGNTRPSGRLRTLDALRFS